MSLNLFHAATVAWFESQFDAPTEPQLAGWPSIRAGRHTLIAAPTGSGKTLAAFLAAIDDLVRQGLEGWLEDETQVVYVSPLKALSNDIHRNLEEPLAGIQDQLRRLGLPEVDVRAMVRTGDTPSSERTKMVRNPPHILVTTPESLYILLTSDGGRGMLSTARTVIVDEIHAVADDKRGSHLALTLERLDELVGEPLVRIGLSATQRPIELVARFLTGTGGGYPVVVPQRSDDDEDAEEIPADGIGSAGSEPRPSADSVGDPSSDANRAWPACEIIDTGHRRDLDLAIELPGSPLEALMSNEVWEETYDRLAALIDEHRSTLIFVNTRRMAERTAHHLSERVGEVNIAAHHGSLAREQRLDAEQRLKAGKLKAMVATASLELGIDIGAVDLVCQLGSTRSIATLLQRVGRSGHWLGGLPKGRLFPTSRDELVESIALIDAARRGELDRLIIPEKPLDILAQQIVAEVAAQDWYEDELFDLMRRAYPFRRLTREEFDEVVRMLAEGFSTRRGRRGAHLHHDQINRRLRARRGARLAALTSGGAIPEVNDFNVILEPTGTFIGTLDQDFAIESLPGDIFQLGNMSYRILRIEQGQLRVEDAHGEPPTIPFWFGEAPGRTLEASMAVSSLRERVGAKLKEGIAVEGGPAATGGEDAGAERAAEGAGEGPGLVPSAAVLSATCRWTEEELGIGRAAAEQLVEYLAAGQAALGVMPTQQNLVIERFFDEAGDMHVVVHSPYGSRLNRAWGLSLRKRFCRSFNFELQASATEDAIILSLGPTHSFPLADVFKFLHSGSVRELLIQALLDAPMFPTRWRWNATRALAVLRWRSGKKVPPHLQQMNAEDLIAVVFPDQLACLENIAGDREIPDHPLIGQTIRDCLEEAMDIDHLEELLAEIEAGGINLFARDLREPSPFSHEIVVARPYAFLDDGEAEERRTLAVRTRRWMDPQTAADIGSLDAAAIARVRAEAWPDVRDEEELHDALVLLGFVTAEEGERDGSGQDDLGAESHGEARAWSELLEELIGQGRATVLRTKSDGPRLWVATERLPQLVKLYPDCAAEPRVKVPERLRTKDWNSHAALVEIVRGRLEGIGPTTALEIAGTMAVSFAQVDRALLALEAEGFAIRGQFTPGTEETEWCDRRLLARIHRYTINRLRQEVQPVSPRDYVSFLFRWQRLDGEEARGPESLERALEQLEGYSAPAAAWESEILPARVPDYDPVWLDSLCLAGRTTWGRLISPAYNGQRNGRRSGPIRTTPIALLSREALGVWRSFVKAPAPEQLGLSPDAASAYRVLGERGASFFRELAEATGLLQTQLENALGELVACGLVTADSFTGLRALLVPSDRRPPRHGARRKGSVAAFGVENAGRWSLFWPAEEPSSGGVDAYEARVEVVARALLRRYGVVFRRVLDRESGLPPWRDLLRLYRRLEARGEIRGGRFVAGFSGEQYALPEAVGLLRKARRQSDPDTMISVSAADPLNVAGVLTPGDRIPALPANRVLFSDGIPVAALQAGKVTYFTELESADRWAARNALVRRHVPPQLRAYLGRSA